MTLIQPDLDIPTVYHKEDLSPQAFDLAQQIIQLDTSGSFESILSSLLKHQDAYQVKIDKPPGETYASTVHIHGVLIRHTDADIHLYIQKNPHHNHTVFFAHTKQDGKPVSAELKTNNDIPGLKYIYSKCPEGSRLTWKTFFTLHQKDAFFRHPQP